MEDEYIWNTAAPNGYSLISAAQNVADRCR
jgi:hypothetical protein